MKFVTYMLAKYFDINDLFPFFFPPSFHAYSYKNVIISMIRSFYEKTIELKCNFQMDEEKIEVHIASNILYSVENTAKIF